jgi:hypothetical protein
MQTFYTLILIAKNTDRIKILVQILPLRNFWNESWFDFFSKVINYQEHFFMTFVN